MKKSYQPDKKIIERYADVMVNFALNKGRGIKKGEVVWVVGPESTKPFFVEILRAITKAGGHAITHYLPDADASFNIERDFYLAAQDHQVSFFPSRFYRGLTDEMHHAIFIEGEADVRALEGIDSKRLMMHRRAFKPFHEWRDEKENHGKFSWTVALYGTPAMAREAGLSEREYWQQIIDACFLNKANPVGEWGRISQEIDGTKRRLDALKIKNVHVVGPDADIHISLGEKRVWQGGGGANIPSFEIFTSPDWRGTEGWMRFNQPVYADGDLIRGVELHFAKGKVVKATAQHGQKLLKDLVNVPNADKLGEFSMTDKRFSKITKFMATTLYDENIGGPNGNTHVALGSSYHECYDGNPAKITKNKWAQLGFNDSAVHQDFISTAPRTVTAQIKGGKEKVIYKDGKFAF